MVLLYILYIYISLFFIDLWEWPRQVVLFAFILIFLYIRDMGANALFSTCPTDIVVDLHIYLVFLTFLTKKYCGNR